MEKNLKEYYWDLLNIIATYEARIDAGTASQEDKDDLVLTLAHAQKIKARLENN